jgi:hypothetical protein
MAKPGKRYYKTSAGTEQEYVVLENDGRVAWIPECNVENLKDSVIRTNATIISLYSKGVIRLKNVLRESSLKFLREEADEVFKHKELESNVIFAGAPRSSARVQIKIDGQRKDSGGLVEDTIGAIDGDLLQRLR